MRGVRDERGAVLVQTGLAIIALLAMGTLSVDYGMLWVSRRQAQNSADAAALAGALSLMLGDDASRVKAIGVATGQVNTVWGQAPNITTSDVFIENCPPNTPGFPDKCVRAEVYRNQERNNPLPTWFGGIVGVGAHGVKASATAQVGSGNTAECMLPFAVIDRWADNYDPSPNNVFFSNDSLTGIAGWTPNDDYTPASSPADVYIPPYDGNTGHTGWKVTADYGRQLILKDGSVGNYSTGWAQKVCLNGPANCGGNDIRGWLETCNTQPVGIAAAADTCTVGDEPHGCIDISSGDTVGPVVQGVRDLVGSDGSATWNRTADGPGGAGKGAVVGGLGMQSPRIRGMVVLDIDHYIASGCTGGTCVGKVANIIGFFLEGMCSDVTLDPGMVCDDPNKDVVGRIVTVPSQYVGGVGSVEDSASFLRKVILVR